MTCSVIGANQHQNLSIGGWRKGAELQKAHVPKPSHPLLAQWTRCEVRISGSLFLQEVGGRGFFVISGLRAIDFTRLPAGENRNLDLRREFHRRLDGASISATTIYNGAFAELLTGQMPLILFKQKRVLYWGNPDQRMDFTTIDDTAAFTARAALDPSTPRFLRIAGDQFSARELTVLVSEVTGEKFKLFRAGSLGLLGALIRVARIVAPAEKGLFPAWQGMQYMRNMFDGRAKLEPLDNDRYPGIRRATARDVLSAR